MADKPKNDGKGTAVGNALRWLAKSGKTIAPGILDIAGNITGIDGLNRLADEIAGDTQLSPEDKELLIAQIEQDKAYEAEVTKRWEADAKSDSWLSKNIRPLTLAFLLATYFIFVVLDSSIPGFIVKEPWITMLSTLLITAVGGYFTLREIGKGIQEYRKTK